MDASSSDSLATVPDDKLLQLVGIHAAANSGFGSPTEATDTGFDTASVFVEYGRRREHQARAIRAALVLRAATQNSV